MIILASNSARRKKLLEKCGIEFEVIASDIEEKVNIDIKPKELCISFAFEKAYDVAQRNPDRFVIGADTAVEIDGRILGKPEDKAEAIKFLKLLSGREHSVITGFAIINLSKNIKIADYEESKVLFKTLSDDEIEDYVSSTEPYDKAGGYAIQGEAGKFVESYHGDYDNIVGLPTEKVIEVLKRFRSIP